MFDSLFGNDDDENNNSGSFDREGSGGGGILGPDLDESQDQHDNDGQYYDDDELDEEEQEPYWFAAGPTPVPLPPPSIQNNSSGMVDLSFNSQRPFDECPSNSNYSQQQQRPSAYRSYAADKISFDEDEDLKKTKKKKDHDDAAAAAAAASKTNNNNSNDGRWCFSCSRLSSLLSSCCCCSFAPYCRQVMSRLLFVCSAVLWTWMVIDHVFLVETSTDSTTSTGVNANSLQFNPDGTQSLSFYYDADSDEEQQQIIFQVGGGGSSTSSSSSQSQVTTTQAYMFASMLCLLLSGLLESCLVDYDNSGKWGGRYLSAFPTILAACCGLASAAVLRFDGSGDGDSANDENNNNSISAYLNCARAHLVMVASFTLIYLLCCVRQSYNKWLQLGGDICWLLSTMADAASSYFFVIPQLTSQPSTYQPYIDYLIVAAAGMWTMSSLFHLANVTCCRHAALDIDDDDDDLSGDSINGHDDIHAAMEEGRKRASMEESSVLKGVETDVTQQPTGGSTEEETDDNDDEISDFYGTRAAAKAERERAKAERDHRRLSKDAAAATKASTSQQNVVSSSRHHVFEDDDASGDENLGRRRRGGNRKSNGDDDDDDNSTMAGTVFSYIVYPGRNKERKIDPEKVTRSSLDDIFGRVARRK